MYQLKPLIHHKIKFFLENNKEFLKELVEKYGSPLNIVFPEIIQDNLEKLKSIFEKEKINYQIFFAHKTTRTFSFVKKIKELKIGIDVSSIGELNNALKAGFENKKIIANGPKSDLFLEKLIDHQVIIIIDSLNEFYRLINLLKKKKKKATILLRFSSDFDYYQKKFVTRRISKFGLIEKEIDEIVKFYLVNNDLIDLIGFSFHINFDSYEKRVNMIKTIIKKITSIHQEKGLSIKIINFGGGWKTNFIESKESWENFLFQFKKYVIGENERLSFNGSKYGYYVDGGRVKGDYTFQTFYTEETGERVLSSIMNEEFEEIDNLKLKKIFQDLDFEVWIEPGAYLINQAGISLFRIIDIKKRDKENIIFVEGNFTNLWADRYELFTDPWIIKQNKKEEDYSELIGYFISGNLCLDIDMISNHKVFLPQVEINDILVFINTASYRMDFVSAQPISQPQPKKIVIENLKNKDYKLESY